MCVQVLVRTCLCALISQQRVGHSRTYTHKFKHTLMHSYTHAYIHTMTRAHEHRTSCADCEGAPYGGKIVDACGICGGSGVGCLDCDGVMHGGKVNDACGVCGGNAGL